MLDLEGIFGDGVEALPATLATDPEAGQPDTPAPGPDAPTIGGEPTGGPDFTRWILWADASGRVGWEAPDLPEAKRWWAYLCQEVMDPEPCPRCGSLELWWDLLGGVHCQQCDHAAFERSKRLIELAEHLRRQKKPKRCVDKTEETL